MCRDLGGRGGPAASKVAWGTGDRRWGFGFSYVLSTLRSPAPPSSKPQTAPQPVPTPTAPAHAGCAEDVGVRGVPSGPCGWQEPLACVREEFHCQAGKPLWPESRLRGGRRADGELLLYTESWREAGTGLVVRRAEVSWRYRLCTAASAPGQWGPVAPQTLCPREADWCSLSAV